MVFKDWCSVVWYSPGEVMWYDYCIKTFISYITVTLPTPKCSSSWWVWDWYFWPKSIAMEQVPAIYPTPPFCFFISSLPHTESFNLTEHSTCPIYLIFPHSTTLKSFWKSSNYVSSCHCIPHRSKYYFHRSILKHS